MSSQPPYSAPKKDNFGQECALWAQNRPFLVAKSNFMGTGKGIILKKNGTFSPDTPN
jgi:hypothetical protein